MSGHDVLGRVGRYELETELLKLRAVPDLRLHAKPCLFPLACGVCGPKVVKKDDLNSLSWSALRRHTRENRKTCDCCGKLIRGEVYSTYGDETDKLCSDCKKGGDEEQIAIDSEEKEKTEIHPLTALAWIVKTHGLDPRVSQEAMLFALLRQIRDELKANVGHVNIATEAYLDEVLMGEPEEKEESE